MRKTLGLLTVLTLFAGLACQKPTPEEETGPRFNRTVLVEVFTNVQCVNCPVADAYVDSLTQANPQVVAVKYHSPRYPFPDPFVSEQVDLRESFYFGNTDHGYPYVYFDGVYGNEGVSGIAGWGNQVADRLNTGSPVTLQLSGVYHGAARAGTLQVAVDGDTGTTAHLFAVLEESGLEHEGETYHQVFRTFVGDPQGTPTTAPDEISLPFVVQPEWNPENLDFVVFFQDPSSKEVLQAARIALSDLTAGTSSDVFHLTPAGVDTSGLTGTTLALRFYLKNVASAADSAFVEVRGIPPDWIVSLCIGEACLPRPNGYTPLLAPGDSIHLDVDLYAAEPATDTLWLFAVAQVGTDRDSAQIHVTFHNGK